MGKSLGLPSSITTSAKWDSDCCAGDLGVFQEYLVCDGALGMARSHAPFWAWNQGLERTGVVAVDMAGQNVPLRDLPRLLASVC